MSTRSNLASLHSGGTYARLESIIERFERAWHTESPPALEQYLGEECEKHQALLVELVHTDLEFRIKAGEPIRVESYLQRYPELASDPGILVDLICKEFALRQRTDKAVAAGEYFERFPQYRELLDRRWKSTDMGGGVGPDDATAPIGRIGAAEIPSVPGYEILDELGRGGMGVVYRALQLALNRTVALKLVAAADADARETARFLVEAEAVAIAAHPNVVQVYECGRVGDRPFMALEYLPGGTLADRLKKGRLVPRAAAEVVEQVARGVAVAHRLGIVHRDIKPGNVLLDDAGRPKVADFGLAKRATGSDLTKTGAVMGTPAYMAPEQAKGDSKHVGPAADVWALGALLYECLTGGPPFRGDDAWAVMLKAMSEDPAPPRARVPEVPRDLEAVCLKCLAKDPRERYPTAAELADDLTHWIRGEPIIARPAGQVERARKWIRRNRAVSAALALGVSLLLAVAIGGVVFAVTQKRSAERIAAEQGRTARRAAAATLEQGIGLCEAGETDRGLVLVAQALELAEQAEAADLADACRWNLAVWAAETHRLSQMLDHTAAVLCLAISPDGRIAATGLEDGSVHLWDLTTGLPTEPTVRHGAAVQTVAFHPTKPILLSGGKDCGIQLWDLRTGQAATPRLTMPTTAKPGDWRGRYGVTCAAFSRDGRLFAAACDTYIRVWDAVADPPAEIARPTWQPLTDRADTFALAFRDEGTLIFAGAHYGYAVCNARTGALVDNRQRFLAGSWGAFALAVSPNGREILAGCEYRIGAVRLGLGDGEPQGPRLPAHGEVKAVDYHPSGDRVAIGDETGTAWLYDAATARPLGPAFRHPAAVSAVRFTADGTRMLTAAGPVVRVWELAPGLLRHTLVHPPNSSVTSAAFAPDGRTILTGCRGLPSEVIQWDLATGRPTAARIPVDRKEGWVMGVGYGPDAARVYAAVSHDGRVKWWGSADGRPLGQTKRHGNNLWRMALSPDGRRVVAATGEQWGDDQTTAALWDAETGLPICPPLTHMAPVTGFAFSPDGRLLLTAAGSDTRLWDADTGAPLADPHEHSTIIRSVGYAPNGDEVVAGGADGAIRRFDPRTWDQRGRTVHHRGQVNAAGYAAHGRLLFTASNDKTARLWHPASGVAVGPPFQHALSVETAVGSADGVHLITGSTDGIAKVWVIPTGPAAGTVAELRAAVRRMTGLELDEQGAFRQLPSTEWAAYPVAADARDVSMRFLSNTVVGPAIAMGP